MSTKFSKRPRKLPRLRNQKNYDLPKPGQWIQPIRRGFRLACCDCGLVHTMNSRIFKGRPQFAVWRNTRATNAMRKHERITVTKGE